MPTDFLFMTELDDNHKNKIKINRRLVDPIEFEKAKKIFKDHLTLHADKIRKYQKNPLTKFLHYVRTGSGETGLKRTENFLKELERVSNMKELILLPNKPPYQKGYNLPFMLKNLVFTVCGFTPEHINVAENELYMKSQIEMRFISTRNSSIAFYNLEDRNIDNIYEKIIHSDDLGASYLEELDKKLRFNKRTFSI